MKTSLLKFTAVFAIAALLSGCALFGSDLNSLYNIKEEHVKVFDKGISSCYDLSLSALSQWKAVVFQQYKDDYIVAMNLEGAFKSCINTTEVGIFFTEISAQKTEIKITSLNHNLSQTIAEKLFFFIEKDGKVPVSGSADASSKAIEGR